MLKKIVKIHNVGRLHRADAQGDQEFRSLTLIYAENGRGKTTLCEILRSLKTGNPDYLIGRRTLAQPHEPEVDFRFDSGNVAFTSGAWTEIHPEIEIFDTTFVRENVYAGDVVEHQHKRNLFRVIVGEHGVTLARRVDEIDIEMRDADREINANKATVAGLAPAGMSADEFVALEADPEVESKIQAAQLELDAIRSSDEIRQNPLLSTLDLPKLPEEFTAILAKGLDNVSADVERTVKDHIDSHTDGASEQWIESGLDYVKDDCCPFCGQNLTAIAIVKVFRSYFSEAYRGLKTEAANLESQISMMGNTATLLRFDTEVATNNNLAQFWSRFVEGETPTLDVELVKASLQHLVRVAHELALAKVAAPLESISPTANLAAALDHYAISLRTTQKYNQAINALNALIDARKRSVAGSNPAVAEATLRHLETVRNRQSQPSINACKMYQDALKKKRDLMEEKLTARKALEQHNEQVIEQFETKINELLRLFGTSFRIASVAGRFTGGRTSATYSIVINDVAIELGDGTSPLSEPSFRNTLSAGDRSSLALAFFLARLEADPSLTSKIVVLDDPFGSQDRSRRTCTQQQICDLIGRTQQVVVLSHEALFLRDIWAEIPQAQTRTLKLLRIGAKNSVIREWDIKEETDPEFDRQIRVLRKYVDDGGGELRAVARTIRPILEAHLRVNSPGRFSDTEWLGDFIAKIRDATPGEPLAQWQPVLAG